MKLLLQDLMQAKHPEKIKKKIGYMCQKFSLYDDLTAKENIMLYGGIYGMSKSLIKERTHELLEKASILRIMRTG